MSNLWSPCIATLMGSGIGSPVCFCRVNHTRIFILPGTDQGDTFQMEMSQVGFSAYYSGKKVQSFIYIIRYNCIDMKSSVFRKF